MKTCKTCIGSLDSTNIRILQHLEKDARTAYATIAKELSLSVNTVRDRIISMQRKGILLGYQPVLNHELCGRPVQAIATLRTKGRTEPLDPSELNHPFIRSAFTCAGPIALMLELSGPSFQEISDFVNDFVYPLGYHSAHLELVHSALISQPTAAAKRAPLPPAKRAPLPPQQVLAEATL